MKPRLFALILFVFILPLLTSAQAGMWTWMNGNNVLDSPGSFGTQGVPSASNTPEPKYAAAHWTDTAGNFWIFGGITTSTITSSSMWRFNPVTNMWTWMNGSQSPEEPPNIAAGQGIYSPLNAPGARGWGSFSWHTPDDHFWLFGGLDYQFAIDDNLWQFDPAINQWAWMGTFGFVNYGTKGVGTSSTMPGARTECSAAWVDNDGNLWFFGGDRGFDQYNDMWKYDVATGIWTWMSGSNLATDPGVYGTMGVPSVNNYPSSRVTNLYWKDDAGNFWLGGGMGLFSGEWFQDVWRFNPQTLEWTWMKGLLGNDMGGAIGSNCDTGAVNKQGMRYENRAVWKVCDGLILNYNGFSEIPEVPVVNDLWAYRSSENDFVQVTNGPLTGSYGTLGVASVSNFPPARCGAIGFKDKSNNLWMFGGLIGEGDSLFQTYYYYNDLWKYVLDTTCFGRDICNQSCAPFSVSITSNTTIMCSGDSAYICAPTGYASYLWNTGQTGMCVNTKAAGNYYVTVTDNSSCTAVSNHLAINVYPLPPVSISVSGDTLRVYGAVTQQWYLNGSAITGATLNIYIASQGGSYSVAVTDSNGCLAISTPVLITGIDNFTEDDVVSVYPNPNEFGFWILECGSNYLGGSLEMFDANGRMVLSSKLKEQSSKIEFDGARGVYLLRINSAKGSMVRKLVRL